MKRYFCGILIALALCALFVGCILGNGQFAHAADAVSYYVFKVDGVNYRLFNTSVNNQITGVYLYDDSLFGSSEIPVQVEIYSTQNLTIDFAIGSDSLNDNQIATRSRLVDLFSDVIRQFTKVNALASTAYDGSDSVNGQLSEVMSYNQAAQGARIQISQDTYKMLQLAQEMYSVTNGAFNPAVYRLVDLWGFSSRIYSHGNFGLPYDREVTAVEFWNNGYPLPDQKYIKAFSQSNFIDFSPNAVILEYDQGSDQYFVTKNVAPAVVDGVEYQQWIDLGGIAKGYAVDQAEALIQAAGIDRYYVDAGSSSKALGLEHDGGTTKIGLQDAFSYFSVLMTLDLNPSGISTSGQYVRKYTVNGVEYSHILDGVSGAPAQTGVKAVTIVAPQEKGQFWAAKGDCLTTALTVMGRDKIVNFVNGYLKENGIKIVVQYETLDGKKQILSNYSLEEVTVADYAKESFSWALVQGDDGVFYYDANAKFDNPTDTYKVVLIVLGCVVGVLVVGIVVYYFIRGKKRILSNVTRAKQDKPFKAPDVMVYLCVVLLIVVLFAVFVFNTEDTQLQVINVLDIETGETLFVYNVTRGEYVINANSLNNWQIQVVETDDGAQVIFTREIGGEQRQNIVQITRGRVPSVVMADSVCGRGKDCVRTFPAITRAGGVIVCSPNRLKIETA